MWASSSSGLRVPLPRSRATRLPLRGPVEMTRMSAAGNPAALRRAAIASAALSVSPVASVVSISTSAR